MFENADKRIKSKCIKIFRKIVFENADESVIKVKMYQNIGENNI